MADTKFSCPGYTQHIECDETLAGHQITCPTCARGMEVPDLDTIETDANQTGDNRSKGMKLTALSGDLEPTTEAELRAFVGSNADYYLKAWSNRPIGGDLLGNTDFSLRAALLIGFWLPYRKLYTAAILFWGWACLFSLGVLFTPSSKCISYAALGAAWLVFAGMANQLYLSKAKSAIAGARSQKLGGKGHLATLAKSGGTNSLAALALPLIFILATVATAIWLQTIGFFNPFGRRLAFQSTEIFYRPPVTKAQALRLKDFLVQSRSIPKHRTMLQLLKVDQTWQLRVIVKEGVDGDPESMELFEEVAKRISKKVFDGEHLELHLCDPQFRMLTGVSSGG